VKPLSLSGVKISVWDFLLWPCFSCPDLLSCFGVFFCEALSCARDFSPELFFFPFTTVRLPGYPFPFSFSNIGFLRANPVWETFLERIKPTPSSPPPILRNPAMSWKTPDFFFRLTSLWARGSDEFPLHLAMVKRADRPKAFLSFFFLFLFFPRLALAPVPNSWRL